MTAARRAPSRTVLDQALAINRERGDENLGFLSESHGFIPRQPPRRQLPASHRAWDAAAAELPRLFRTQTIRAMLDTLPLIAAAERDLPDPYLWRASGLLSILAQAYYRASPIPPAALPDSILQPWQEVSRRLGRAKPFLSYADLIVHNWTVRDPTAADPMRVEHLDLLISTVGNQEERVFYLTQVEILAQCAPIVGAVVRSQEAVLAHDTASLERELLMILERLQYVTEVSLPKIDPNPYSQTYVDPVVWAKTVAPFATPIRDDVPGPSGTASPIFHLFDIFLGRPAYDSFLGTEMTSIRRWYPRHWRHFLDAVTQVSVREFVSSSNDPRLQGIFHTVMEHYTGDKGFFGAHQLKVYGYLEMAFKMGRSVTIGGFRGLFKDREWHRVDAELRTTRHERRPVATAPAFFATPAEGQALTTSLDQPVNRLVLDITDSGLLYRPGDRLGLLPENSDTLIKQTLEALHATGTEPIRLDQAWQQAVHRRAGGIAATELPLALLLRYGRIRPVSREVAKALAALTASDRLHAIVNARAEDQWELWDILQLLERVGFDARRLWRAQPWEPESICKIVPPESARLYSIASARPDLGSTGAQQLELAVARLTYDTDDGPTSHAGRRAGTASSFIDRVVSVPTRATARIAVQVVPAARFHLPADHRTPIIMVAGGAGVAPFRGFLYERAKHADAGEAWLFCGTRTRADLLYRDELASFVAAGQLQLRVAFSRDDAAVRLVRLDTGGDFTFEPGERSHIQPVLEQEAQVLWDLLRAESEGGRGAHLYVCGRTDFAAAVRRAVRSILERFSDGPNDTRRAEHAAQRFYRLVADGRYLEDIFTTYPGPHAAATRRYDASEVVMHNDEAHGRWFVIGGKVYDVGAFRFLHPGGDQIIAAYCGIDATDAYRRVQHHLNPEVDALLTMHEIGAMHRLDFGARWAVVVGPTGLTYVSLDEIFRLWVRYLYLIVEMENALAIDQSVLLKSTTAGEDSSTLTPYKVQLAANIHARFVSLYLDGLTGGDLHELWVSTTGLCQRDAHVLTMQRLIAEATASADATLARTAGEQLQRLGEQWSHAVAGDDGVGASVAQMEALCALLSAQDQWLLAQMKRSLRAGVQVFEEYAADTAERGGERLMASVEQVPRLVRQYYRVLAHGVRAILADADITGTPTPPDAGVAAASTGWCSECGAAVEPGSECSACGAPFKEATARRHRFIGHGI